MRVDGVGYRSIWFDLDAQITQIIDQRALPFEFVVETLQTLAQFETAIRAMHVRGAPLIGVTAAYGMAAALKGLGRHVDCVGAMSEAAARLQATRPTAVNLKWALDQQLELVRQERPRAELEQALLESACAMADEDAERNRRLGEHGVELISELSRSRGGKVVNVLTHCNAGWLATVDYGTATAPIYLAHDAGVKVHVWVDETRPRNQGAKLTAWELGQHGVPHTLVADNAGGHLMQHGLVDLVLTGTDRTTRTGDVANKIGTYLKALAARDNEVPFYVALPSPSIDWEASDGIADIPIEERHSDEVRFMDGWADGKSVSVQVCPDATPASNFGFDVTPARLVTGLITERGICAASARGLASLFPKKAGDRA
ncbi:MAG: S-methyl-5-thioribose-1-phosphate isomerase [Planctomycetota bacterium]|jgi:methylthioribose-1-phosphate isomerase